MRQLAQALRRYQVPLLEVTCADGVMRIVMGEAGEAALEARLLPGATGQRGWGAAGGFTLGYQGQGDLGQAREGWMRAVQQVVELLDHVLPPALDEPGALFLRKVSAEERFRKSFPFCEVERSEVGGDRVVELLLRSTSRCNQSCPFCSAAPRRAASPEAVRACLRLAARVYPGCLLSLTGGEPTLRPGFLDEVLLALGLRGIGQVQVQTNAVAFGEKLDPAALPARPDLSFFASMHSLDEGIYDACTNTTGQFAGAVRGVRRLLQAGHRVTINCVVQRLNLDHLERYVEALPATFPISDRAALHFSVLICPEYRPGAADYLVRYTELAPRLEAAARRAADLGVPVDPPRSSTHASIPACLLDPAVRDRDAHRPEVRPGETGYEDRSLPWLKAARCRGCAEDRWCLGLPAAYAERFGLDELAPISPSSRTPDSG